MDHPQFAIPCAYIAQRDIAFDQLRKARDLFGASEEFQAACGEPLPEITKEDQQEATKIFYEAPDAPIRPTTPGAALALDRMLKKYDYILDDPSAKMRNYVMYKFLELAEDPDPKVSMRALENLAKTADIGLFSERVEININQRTTVDLEADLSKLIHSVLERQTNTKALDTSSAVDGEFE